MKVALAQINPTLGDFENNRKQIQEGLLRAKKRRCDLVVFPELSLFGYSPYDLLERDSVVEEQLQVFERLCKAVPDGIVALVGLVTKNKKKTGRRYHNSVALLQKGKKPRFFHKSLLPNYDVFDDVRHFEPGDMKDNIVTIKGVRTLITICEDMWAWEPSFDRRLPNVNPMAKLTRKGVQLVLNLSASPFSLQKDASRRRIGKKIATQFKAPFLYVNMVGGQDEVVYDGGSFALDSKGACLAENMFFQEDFNTINLKTREGGFHTHIETENELLHGALVLGIRDYIEKQGLKHVHLGLSGGIDSAVVLCLACDALGPSNVTAIMMPGPFSSEQSLTLSESLVKKLGCGSAIYSIKDEYELASKNLGRNFGIQEFGTTHENIQARLRGLILMAYSNAKGSLLLSTSNKSEYSTGYATLYGDMCGGLAPIGDLTKHQVYQIAEYYNAHSEIIPAEIISRAPTAELRANQKDQDSLPPYDILDAAVDRLVTGCGSPKNKTESWVLERLYASEFKRWQAPPILRVSGHSFGRGRRYPIVNKCRA